MKKKFFCIPVFFLVMQAGQPSAQFLKSKIMFTVSMEHPASQLFHVQMTCVGLQSKTLNLKMPVWTPGYYQRLDYARHVENFRVKDNKGRDMKWSKPEDNTWQFQNNPEKSFTVSYDVKATRAFVATPYLDENRGYILPAGVFLYVDGMLRHPVEVIVKPYAGWSRVATGLDSVAGKQFTYTAPDFDILYDCPFLAGNLEELPSFTVRGIPHRFIGYQLGNFDKVQFMNDLKKIVETAADLIGDIPYKHYTFIAIGPGAGGIEHLNNTTVSFNGSGLHTPEGRLRLLHFLAHEYFHHYNVKRIRPIELGPFDYDHGSRTRLLWVSEGWTVYYEYLIVKRAGLSTTEELLNAIRKNILAFEGKPGRLFQTLEQASYQTWSDGPFGRTSDEVNKTISYYDKGPVVGMLFDFTIRHLTQNKKSLDDVMRFLYYEYYKKKKRGFTEAEFRKACEDMANAPLQDVFRYVSTTDEIDYPRYLSYAGLEIDTVATELPGVYAGFTTQERNDSLFVTAVDWESPAWQAGLRSRQYVQDINGMKATAAILKETIENAIRGDSIRLTIHNGNEFKSVIIITGVKKEKSFQISLTGNPNPLQKQILESWLKG